MATFLWDTIPEKCFTHL